MLTSMVGVMGGHRIGRLSSIRRGIRHWQPCGSPRPRHGRGVLPLLPVEPRIGYLALPTIRACPRFESALQRA